MDHSIYDRRRSPIVGVREGYGEWVRTCEQTGRPLPDLAAFIARCEEAGFDDVGIHDHPSSGRDAYLALALAARATGRL